MTQRLLLPNPVYLTFVVSLVLSAIAVWFNPVIAKDTAFYFDVAQTFNQYGLRAAFEEFDWPWLSVLFGMTHMLTGLPWETIGRLWTAFFMAGSCALMVSLIARRAPQTAWWAVLVVLAMPAFNQFRGDMLREHGAWCLSVLAMWLAFVWDARGGWARALAMQIAVLGAALFRLEVIVLMPAFVLWRLLQLREPYGVLRLMQAVLLPVLAIFCGVAAVLWLDAVPMSRVHTYYSYLLDPKVFFVDFASVSQRFGDMLPKWSQDETGTILVFGFLGVLILRFVRLLGLFAVPFLSYETWQVWRTYWQRFMPMVLTLTLYFCVLTLFFFKHLFINSRYSALLNLMTMPLAVLATHSMASRFPRTARLWLVAGVAMMLVNVISLSAKKTHYIDAGNWFAQHVERFDDDIYFDDHRIAWYAGWGYRGAPLTRESALGEASADVRYYALETKPDEAWLTDWLARHPGRRVLAQFANRKGATVVIIGTCADTPTAPVCQAP